jgi:hypothetical protein
MNDKKMKAFMLLFSFAMIMLNLHGRARDFAPVGATWHYTEGFAFEKITDYLTIRSVKDTVILGKSCQRLDCENLCLYPSGRQYIHYSNDSLYRYNPDFNEFQLIAAFNAQKGERWKFLLKDLEASTDTVTVKVDSVIVITINQHPLRQLFVSYQMINYNAGGDSTRSFSYTSRIVEKLGDVQYLFNFPLTINMVCDGNYSEGLRCYEDAAFGFYSTGIAPSCTYQHIWIGIKDHHNVDDLKLFPNPTKGLIHIAFSNHKNLSLQVNDLTGRCLFSESLNSSQVDLSALPNGLYVITVMDQQKIMAQAKVVKN